MKKLWVTMLMALATVLSADVKLADIFSDGMVLQRDMPVRVWGWSEPGETVTVTVNGQSGAAAADASGRWLAELPPMPAGGPFTLTATAASGAATRDNVLVGEVWLCSGQSNMEWQLKNSTGGAEAAVADPNIRLFRVPYRIGAQPLDDIPYDPNSPLIGRWTECTPESALEFSGVGYFFGRKLSQELGVPVGLISSHWGGTAIEPWISPEGLHMVPSLAGLAEWVDAKAPGTPVHERLADEALAAQRQWLAAAQAARDAGEPIAAPPEFPEPLRPMLTTGHPWQTTGLYNAMIHPLVPYAMRGAVWYQGCGNVGNGMSYADKLEALHHGWRELFRNPDFGFYLSQLAPFNYGAQTPYWLLPELMEAQAAYARRDPQAHMAVINDVGNLADIHPRDKREVGERLANQALKYQYGRADLPADFAQATGLAADGASLVVTFDQPLATAGGAPADWFEIAGADGAFFPAAAAIAGNRVTLTAPEVSAPFMVRFAWSQLAEPNLRNQAGLPVGAFRLGEIPARGTFDEVIADADQYQLLYKYDILNGGLVNDNRYAGYTVDNSASVAGKVVKVGYFWQVTPKNGKPQYLFATLPAFTGDVRQLGLPTTGSGASFQQPVEGVEVTGNIPGLHYGRIAHANLEFWPCNYAPQNSADVPGASDQAYDFGDAPDWGANPGYASMQLHDTDRGETVFAFNNWSARNGSDLGFGNRPEGNPDWTFSAAAGNYDSASLLVFVVTE